MDPTNLANGWFAWLFYLGLVVIVAGFAVMAYRRFAIASVKRGGYIAGIGIVVLLFGVVAGALTPAATTGTVAPTAPSGATVSSYVATTSPALPAGCTYNSALATPTVTCDFVYNYTGNFFFISATNSTSCTATCGTTPVLKPTVLYIPIHSARTDSINSTFGFNYQVTSIPTANSLGANPQTYSIVGYKPATSTAPGQWLSVWGGAGSFTGQNPNVNAPSVSTNLGVNTVGIAAFNSKQPYVDFTLAGSNSTSAPTTFYSALQVYTPYSITISVSNSVPSTFLVNMILLGEHA